MKPKTMAQATMEAEDALARGRTLMQEIRALLRKGTTPPAGPPPAAPHADKPEPR